MPISNKVWLSVLVFLVWVYPSFGWVIDHDCTDLSLIPPAWIAQAKEDLHIAYGHTSHGSQLTTGMDGLVGFINGGGLGLSLPADIFAWNNGGSDGALDLHDYAMGGDVGYYPQWVNNTRDYLDNPAHADVNVIIWSWCGQVDDKYAAGTLGSEYLTPMTQLENEYPNVIFVYMTGHVDIWDDANNKAANQMIRDYCTTHNKVLYDFARIEHYDPDGVYYEYVNDDCGYYDGPGGTRLGNWAQEWQNSHTEDVDWYSCVSAHSEPLNANRKAYAAWWLWARLAGWSGSSEPTPPPTAPLPTPTPCSLMISLDGYVTDALTGVAIKGAQVVLATENNGFFTDATGEGGYYSISAPADECTFWDYSLTVMAPGYYAYRGMLSLPVDPPADIDFELTRAAASGGGDFNGDGTGDPAFFRPDTRLWRVRGSTQFYFGRSGDIPLAADFDGDGSVDNAYYRPSQGLWWVQGKTKLYFGRQEDIPVPSDYNGDGTDEVAFYRPSQGLWKTKEGDRVYCGKTGSIPVPQDYDGDGSADFAYFSAGLWVVRGQTRFWRGREGDIPVPGNYSEEGVIAGLYRPSSGLWIVNGSRIYFGRAWDSPYPADYDGDTTTDLGVFRSGRWSILGQTSFYFGQEGDYPLTR